MKISKIKELLEASVLCGEELLDGEVNSAFGCDMMSDVLAFVKDQAVLITGLCNPQVVRTAMMMDMKCIVFVRGKVPNEAVVELARDAGIVVLASEFKMYGACGILYENGLRGGQYQL
jgi:predicted transcriptional regulator